MGGRGLRGVVLAAGAAIALLAGCTSPGAMNSNMSTWIGRTAGELEATWGPATRTIDDGAGGRLIVYESIRDKSIPGTAETTASGWSEGLGDKSPVWGTAAWNLAPSRTTTSLAWRMFRVDGTGVITDWRWRGW